MNEESLVENILDAVVSKRTLKTGYVRQPGGLYPADCDTVAGHSHAVSVIALSLAFEIYDELKTNCGVILNIQDVATLAIFHDHGEARSGDTGAQSLAMYGECRLFTLERDALEASVKGFRIGDTALRLFDDYRKYSTPESLVVHSADILEGFEKALERFHHRPWVLDDSLKILGQNVIIFRQRDQAESRALGKVANFLVDQILIPGARGLLKTYAVAVRLEDVLRPQESNQECST